MGSGSELDLSAEASAAGIARSFVRSWLLARGLERLLDSVVLLTSELVANAVLHACGPMRMQVAATEGGVRVAVTDGSPVGPTRRRHGTRATTGRGIQLVHDIADDWGWEPSGTGKTVWFVSTTAADRWSASVSERWLVEAES